MWAKSRKGNLMEENVTGGIVKVFWRLNPWVLNVRIICGDKLSQV